MEEKDKGVVHLLLAKANIEIAEPKTTPKKSSQTETKKEPRPCMFKLAVTNERGLQIESFFPFVTIE